MTRAALEQELAKYRGYLEANRRKGWSTEKLEGIVANIERKLNGEDPLHKALELADLRVIVAEHYPDASVDPDRLDQYIKGVWRGGDSLNVQLSPGLLYDHKFGESYGAWTFLTLIAGLSEAQAAKELIYRAGLSEDGPAHQVAARRTRDVAKERVAERRKAQFLAERLEFAQYVQAHGLTKGESGYLKNKEVNQVLLTHHVLGGLVYTTDERDNFIQVPYQNLSGETQGYQRLYDSRCLVEARYKDDKDKYRDKDFIGSTKGAAIVLLPIELDKLPHDVAGLAQLHRRGYRVALAEGFSTGASVALAKPKTIMLCALNAGNLEPVATALRERYGERFPRRFLFRQRFSFDVYADDDRWGEKNIGLEKATHIAKTYGGRLFVPTFKREHHTDKPADFNDLYCLEGLGAVRQTQGRLIK